MVCAKFYYPRHDATYLISANDYTDLVRILSEFRGCVVEKIYNYDYEEELDDED